MFISMCAFGTHSFKEIARSQLASVAKFFLKGDKKSTIIPKADKYQLASRLAPIFIEDNIVKIKEGANTNKLSREDIVKVGTF